ncbi:MAG: hypothetical protein COY80_00450 [Candidatus Pacebacteria bacterium CG_4_10_14_0_8_um_filter_42_14]|nr:MAG: hypothetical protein COY80_00450 [Candidatus Pacebacteria bacterium CG_4_10_14_0_8_um_filter_42_14]
MSFLFALIPLGLLFASVYGLYVAVQFVRTKFGKTEPTLDATLQVQTLNNPFVLPSMFGFAVLTLLVGFNIGLYDTMPANKVPTMGLAIFQISMGIGWLLLFSKRKLTSAVWLLVASAILSGVLLPFRANGFVQSFNAGVWMISTFALLALYVRSYSRWSFLDLIQSLLASIPAFFTQGLLMIGSVFQARSNKQSKIFDWLKTIGITTVVLLFFITLLSQSDPVFNEMVKDFREQLFGRTLWSLLILMISGAVLSIALPDQSDEPWRLKIISYRDVLAVLIATFSVIGLFLFVQFQYLFAGSRELLVTLDLTFSEYVRKGFVELLIATFAGGVLVYLATLKQRVLEVSQATLVRFASSALVIELFLLLGSALKRDLLYVDTYGLTRVRVVGGLFLFWLAGLLLMLLLFAIWKRVRELDLIKVVWGLSLIVWLTLNIMNVDKIVALGSPEHHEYTDYYYITNLSEDAASLWPEMIKNIDTDTQRLLTKDSLSDVEMAELAGLKLSLVAVMEKRESLYMRNAKVSWVLENYDLLNVEKVYQTDFNNYQEYGVIPVNGDQAKATPENLPEGLSKSRGWRFYNSSEKMAYSTIVENQKLFFDEVDALYRQIQEYQVSRKVDLYKHEQRLLTEFEYPFITINLRYSAQELSNEKPMYGRVNEIDGLINGRY